MKWDDAIRAIVAELKGHYGLNAALGGVDVFGNARVYRSSVSQPKTVPSVEYFIVTDNINENTEAMTVQFDIWASTYAAVVAIEEIMRAVLHKDTPQTIGGIRMFTLLQEGRDLPDPEPELVHRSLDILFEHAR